MFNIKGLWIVFTFLLSMGELALCKTAFAKDALSVDVQFENAYAGTLWTSNEVPGIRSRIQAALVDHLSKNFGPWTFSSSQPSFPVVLRFRVVERIPNEISMALELELRQVNKLSSLAQEVWKRPADLSLQGFPSADQADAIIGKAFVSLLLEGQKLAIQQKLQDQVPLALGGQWNDPSQSPGFLVVLPLSWDKYQQLRSSVFRLACEWPGHGEAELESMAPGSSATFTPSRPAESPYQALVVVPQWRVHLGNRDAVTSTNSTEVRQLNPRLIFLKERREPMLWDLFTPGGNQP